MALLCGTARAKYSSLAAEEDGALSDDSEGDLPPQQGRRFRDSFGFSTYQVLFYAVFTLYIITLAGICVDPVPEAIVTFEEDHLYTNSLPDDQGSPWKDLIPEGHGFIVVDNPAAWGLSGGYPTGDYGETGPEAEAFCISMFHQLHCLSVIQGAIKMGHANGSSPSSLQTSGSQPPRAGQDPSHSPHIDHCVDYLRQAILCAGDTTLEKVITANGKLIKGVDGWGVAHQCRDWKSIYNFTAKSAAKSKARGA